MAKVGITFGGAMDGIAPVYAGGVNASESFTSSGTSQSTTAAVTQRDEVVRVATSGGPIWVRAGAAPTAAAGDDYLVPDGGTIDLGRLTIGWKVAIIDA